MAPGSVEEEEEDSECHVPAVEVSIEDGKTDYSFFFLFLVELATLWPVVVSHSATR